MTNAMTVVETKKLIGEALNWAVGQAKGLSVFVAEPQYGTPYRVMVHGKRTGSFLAYQERFAPSTDWSQGGPLVESLLLSGKWELVRGAGVGDVMIQNWSDQCIPVDGTSFNDPSIWFASSSPLVAVCRAVVASALGDTVEVPAVLVAA